jgi:hypothetical protein
MAPNHTVPLPNPLTPMAYLPPGLAGEYQGVTYLYVGTLSVSPKCYKRILAKSMHRLAKAFVWDWLMSIPEEYEVCRKRQLSPVVVAYFVSR